ncbi:MAG TPA: PAS domain S-box protein, partial [Planctomycetaceae bacterium]|nr:PAS domain S-box protein [Planctomycetaceae bacterium]
MADSDVLVGKFQIESIAQQREPYLTNSVVGDPRIHDQEFVRREGLTAFAGYPLICGGHLFGVMALASRRPISEAEFDKLRVTAEAMATGIDRWETEQAFVLANQQKQLVLDAAFEISIIATDLQGVITTFNRGAEKMLGYAAEEMLNRQTPAVFHDASEIRSRGEELTRELGRPIEEFDVFVTIPDRDGSETREWTYVRKDGQRLTVELVVTVARDAAGHITGYLGVATDITERKRAAAQRDRLFKNARDITERTAEELFRNLSEHSLVGIQILQDGRYVYANSKLAEIFGYTVEEILALGSWTTVVAPEDRDMVLDQVRRRLSGELPRAHYVFRGLRKDQTVIDVEVRSDRIEMQGRPAAMGMLIDVSERQRAEETVRASEERFRTAFELTNMPMVLTDLDHRFVRVNEAFARLFGYSQQEILKLSLGDITHPDDLTESYARREPLLAGKADYFQMEKRYLHRDGHVIWALTNVSLIRDSLGHPWQYVGQVQDITERQMALLELRQTAEELRAANATIEQERAQLAQRVAERTAELTAANTQLDQANRAKSDFLASMSHELRTPLNGILGMNELLLNTELTERQRQFVQACSTSGKALLQQINDILDL